jgi:DinB superfamily
MRATGLNNESDKYLRNLTVHNLRGGDAHMSVDNFINDFPVELCNRQVDGLPYTPWQVLEHMRIAQWDILEFARNPKHVSPDFPKGYWPKPSELGNTKLWSETVEKFRSDLRETEVLVLDPATNLFLKFPHGNGQTVLRQALLIADHNAYHLGVLVAMGRILKTSL